MWRGVVMCRLVRPEVAGVPKNDPKDRLQGGLGEAFGVILGAKVTTILVCCFSLKRFLVENRMVRENSEKQNGGSRGSPGTQNQERELNKGERLRIQHALGARPGEFSLIPPIFHEICPYHLDETDRSAPTGGLQLKNINSVRVPRF